MYLGVGIYLVLERGDEMNTVASFIRPFIRLFSFVFVQRTTWRNFTVVGKKKQKQKRYRRQKEPSIKKALDFLRGVGGLLISILDNMRGTGV